MRERESKHGNVNLWGTGVKVIQEFFVLVLQLFCKPEIMTKYIFKKKNVSCKNPLG